MPDCLWQTGSRLGSNESVSKKKFERENWNLERKEREIDSF